MNESLKTNVNLDVLNGTCCSLFPVVFLTSNARIHSFKASRLLFISAPSARRLLLLLCVSLSTAEDVIEMMLAGATAVEVGAANLVNPYVCRDIIRELPKVMEKYGINNLNEIIGGVK